MQPPPEPPKVIAHRGASGRWAEHTRAAYLQAIDDGADGLECDVQLTADGVAVCWHDPTVDRTSNGSGALREVTWAQLRGLDVASWKASDVPPRYGGPGEQVLAFVDLVRLAHAAGRPLELAVEFKRPAAAGFGAVDPALEVLREAGWEPRTGRFGGVTVTFMSFDPGSLRRLAATVPTRQLMLLIDEVDGSLADLGGRADLAALGALGPSWDELGVGPSVAFVRAQPELARAWVEEGRLVRVWTVDDADELALCRAVGAQEVTTNVPAHVRRLLDVSD